MSETNNSNQALQTFNYEGCGITFQTGDGVMVNATQMAKQFGKLPNDWLRLPGTQEFINELLIARKSRNCDYQAVITRAGAPETGGGTWLHEDAAIEFARWLSPKFAIWCNDRIKELLTTGVATASDDDAAILHAMQVLQRRVEAREIELKEAQAHIAIAEETIEQQERQIRMSQGTIEEQTREIKALAPDAQYTRDVLQSDSTYAISDVAKELRMSGNKLYAKLKALGILFKRGEKWFPYEKYVPQGYFATRTVPFFHRDGTPGSSSYTVLTELGRQWLHSLNLNF
ncbi:MAG: phage antirepressor KilAC domain-containing protein [Salinivirgaceae bacterium]|nr:phage antirepressor KilAC domain-containing protein [Salinivirgaceae bacterium]